MRSREQIALGEQQIINSRRAHDLSEERLKNSAPQDLGRSYGEALLAIRAKAGAQVNYLAALSAYDKAQVRLLLLLGHGNGHQAPPHAAPDHPGGDGAPAVSGPAPPSLPGTADPSPAAGRK